MIKIIKNILNLNKLCYKIDLRGPSLFCDPKNLSICSYERSLVANPKKALVVLESALPFVFYSQTFVDPNNFRAVGIEYLNDTLGIRPGGDPVSSEDPVRVDRFFEEIFNKREDLDYFLGELERCGKVEDFEVMLSAHSALAKPCRFRCSIVRLKHGQFFLQGMLVPGSLAKKVEGAATVRGVEVAIPGDVAQIFSCAREPASSGKTVIGNSAAMQKVRESIDKISPLDTSVFVKGVKGTGKELVARMIHERSSRAGKPFVIVDCVGTPESLLETELFGHSSGTDLQVSMEKGLFEAAEGGTIFLDEISGFSFSLQAKLLRVLQDGEIRIPGTVRYKKVDVRVIAASVRDLEPLVAQNRWRDDLFYEICVFAINTPLLADCEDDLFLLAENFLEEFSKAHHKKIIGLSAKARSLLKNHSWPGNVRELRHVIKRAAILCKTDTLQAADIRFPQPPSAAPPKTASNSPNLLDESMENLSRMKILAVLEKNRWNKTLTAKELKMSRATLWRKLKELSIPNAK